MMEKKTAIVLGAISNHISLITELKSRGFYVILLDYKENKPVSEFADEFLLISTFDDEAIKALAVERQAQVIINCCIDQINRVISKVSGELGLPCLYDYETAVNVTNKEISKDIMIKSGIPTTKFVSISDSAELDNTTLSYPVFVKPSDGYGSNGVKKAENLDEAKEYVEIAKQYSRNSRIIVEEEARGCEYNTYCFPANGKANVLMTFRRVTDNESSDKVTKIIGIVGPVQLSKNIEKKIENIALSISKTFGLENTPMFMQIMIDEQTETVNVIEFSVRMAGGFSDVAIKRVTGFDTLKATVNACLGQKNEIVYSKPSEFVSVCSIYASSCVFDCIEGYEHLLADGTLSDIFISKTKGSVISEERQNANKVAFIINQDKSMNGLADKIDTTLDSLLVYDVNKEQKMKKFGSIRKYL